MTVFQECVRETVVAFGPIILACLIGAICWAARYHLRTDTPERKRGGKTRDKKDLRP